MKSRPLSVLISSAVSCIVLLGMSEGLCLLKECVRDDASIRATAILGVPLLIAYVMLSWLLVFPVMLWLKRRWGSFLAALLVSLAFGVAMALTFHMPSIDGSFLHTALHVAPWFAVPWLVAGLAAIALWPNPLQGLPPKSRIGAR